MAGDRGKRRLRTGWSQTGQWRLPETESSNAAIETRSGDAGERPVGQEVGSSKSSLLVAVHNLARLPSRQNEPVASV